MTEKEIKKKARELKNEYQREWRKKNPNKVKAANERHWKKKAMEALAKEDKA